VFVLVYAAALLTTLAPAVRAAHVHPAEALRYE
jgi:ABC-type lipoprotein release transport system permease subunit